MKNKILILIGIFFLFSLILFLNFNFAGFVFQSQDISLETEIIGKDIYFFPGENIPLNIRLYQLNDQPKKNVQIKILFEDELKNIDLFSTQTISLETQASNSILFKIPEDFQYGRYNLVVEIREQNSNDLLAKSSNKIIITSKEVFNPINSKLKNNSKKIIILIIFILIFVTLYNKIYKNKN